MLQSHYNPVNANYYSQREISLNDLAFFFKIAPDQYGRDQILVKTTPYYGGNDQYIAISDLFYCLNSFMDNYNTNIQTLSGELSIIKSKLAELDNLEPATNILDRIEKLEFLIQEN